MSALLCRVTLAFPSGENFTFAPATPRSANTAGESGFTADAQRSQKTANKENPQACKCRLDFVFRHIVVFIHHVLISVTMA